jgi:hypothetical protein
MVLLRGNEEPALDELLDDPVMRIMLARDGLTAEDVRALVAALRRRGVPLPLNRERRVWG